MKLELTCKKCQTLYEPGALTWVGEYPQLCYDCLCKWLDVAKVTPQSYTEFCKT